jgi:hypothetical protein
MQQAAQGRTHFRHQLLERCKRWQCILRVVDD